MAITPNPITFTQSLATFLASYGVELDNEKEESTLDPTPWDWGNLIDCYVQAQWEHNRGDPYTVKCVAGGSRTAVADVALAANQFLVRRAGGIQGDTILATDLPSHTHAQSSVTNLTTDLAALDTRLDALESAPPSHTHPESDVTGLVADLAGIDSRLDALEAGIVSLPSYSLTFGVSPTVPLTGTVVIDSRNWVVANEAAATLYEHNAAGLHFDASTNNNAFSSSSQTAPRITTTWADIFGSNFDPSGVYELSIRYSSLTIGTNNNKVNFGLTNPAAFTDIGHVALQRLGGVIVSRFEGAGASAISGPSPGAADCLHLIVEANLVRGYFSTWSGGFVSRSSWTFVGQNSHGTGANADGDSATRADARIVISGATGETGAAMDYVVSAFRARQIR